HPDDRAHTSDAVQQLIAGQAPGSFENRIRCRDGSYRWLIWQLTAVAERQQIYGIAREKSSDLIRAQETLNAIIQEAPAAIIALKGEKEVTKGKRAAKKI